MILFILYSPGVETPRSKFRQTQIDKHFERSVSIETSKLLDEMINAINASHQSVKPRHQASCQLRPGLLSICYSPGERFGNLCKKQMFPEVRHIASAKINKGYLPIMICEAPAFLQNPPAEPAAYLLAAASVLSRRGWAEHKDFYSMETFSEHIFSMPSFKHLLYFAATPPRTLQTAGCSNIKLRLPNNFLFPLTSLHL